MSPEFAPYPFTSTHYPATPRDAVASGEPNRHPVVVVGGGPVGTDTALGLASHGVRSVLVEADDCVCSGSRAICISRRSLEIVERLGALDGFLREGPAVDRRHAASTATPRCCTSRCRPDDEQKLPPMVNIAQYRSSSTCSTRRTPGPI